MKITQEQIDGLISQSEIQYIRAFETVTICAIKLPNEFTLIGHAACIDKDSFDEEIGKRVALNNAKQSLWQLEGYRLLSELQKDA